ncbi:MAG: S8 family serine peptidase, partial [Candidatus Kerfeldbacteria bacterium]|nr:S8 family serine peptidase [Candidatus Kerfeldbacteria bacterium]
LAYPARYDEVISVGATRFDDARAPYSNYGSGLDLVAPGGDLDVDQNGDGQPDGILQQTCTSPACSSFNEYYYEGTSQAAPHVSAAAALLLAAGIPSGNIRAVIEGSVTDLGAAGYDTTFGWGRLNVSRALSIGLNDTVAPSGTVIISSDATYTNSTNVSLTLSASDQESNVSAMSFSNDGSTFLAWEPYATIRSGWDLTAAGGSEAEGVRRVYARFRDAAGNVSAASTDDVIADYTQPTKPALTVRAAAPFDQVQIVSGVSTSVKSLTAIWTAASDGLSGLAGYRIALSPQADADLSTQSLTQSQTYTTAALDSSRTLFLHLAAYDQAGNASATVSFVYVFQQLRVAAGTAGRQGTVAVVQTSGKVDQRVTPFGAQSVNGISVTSLTYVNGQPDYLAVVARQRARTVKIIAPNGKEVVSFSPYGRTVAGGVNLAGADLDGDGRSELLVAPRAGRLPVRVFSVEGKLIREMYPFGRTYSGGVSVAVAGEATEPSIVVGRLTGTPTVRILSKRGAYVRQFSAFPKSGTHGVNVAAGDVNGDGRDEVVVARATGNAEVRVYSLQKKQLKKFSVFSKSFNRGLGIATGDYDGDGRQEILTVPANGAAQVQLHAFSGKLVKRFFALPKSFRSGASLAGVQ